MISEKAVYSIILILIIAFLYNNWDKKQKENKKIDGYNLVEKFFLSDTKSLATINKPIIWIHVTYDWNARKWQTFGSRMTMNLNQDYLYLTLRSIIEKYGNDFHICLINDNSFEKLLDRGDLCVGNWKLWNSSGHIFNIAKKFDSDTVWYVDPQSETNPGVITLHRKLERIRREHQDSSHYLWDVALILTPYQASQLVDEDGTPMVFLKPKEKIKIKF